MLLNKLESGYLEKFGQNKDQIFPEKSIGELTKLSILPNYTCNFSCSYCYSASGRSNKELDPAHASKVIDFFIDPARLKGRNLFMSVLGGGEPLLSWDVVKFAISYARERAAKYGFTLGIGLTTNGSVMSDEMIQFLKKHNVIVSISFEILEDVQDAQRQQYRKVCAVIDSLLANDVAVTVKSIITKLNVNRLEEMVAELIRRFPAIKKLKLQPVEDNAIFPTREELAQFYSDFTVNFFRALDLGEKHGMDVYCLAYKFADLTIDHYCGGEVCLTPEGTISICHRVSSPQEAHYSNFVYGAVSSENNLSFDTSKFKTLISHDAKTQEKCQNCIAKWHCGGGCLAQAHTYDEEKLDVICDWTRDFLKQILFRRFESDPQLMSKYLA
jgi:radical SAM protein with 4Fe4S-binding SPASM domain